VKGKSSHDLLTNDNTLSSLPAVDNGDDGDDDDDDDDDADKRDYAVQVKLYKTVRML